MSRRHHLANPLRNPVAAAIIKRQIVKDLASLQTEAQIHALIGENDERLIQHAARLAYIAANSARACRLPDDSPDVRIVKGMAHALADLANRHGDRELHRLSVLSGLEACGRLLDECSPWAIGTAAIQFDEKTATAGLTLFDITQPQRTA